MLGFSKIFLLEKNWLDSFTYPNDFGFSNTWKTSLQAFLQRKIILQCWNITLSWLWGYTMGDHNSFICEKLMVTSSLSMLSVYSVIDRRLFLRDSLTLTLVSEKSSENFFWTSNTLTADYTANNLLIAIAIFFSFFAMFIIWKKIIHLNDGSYPTFFHPLFANCVNERGGPNLFTFLTM